MRPKSGNIQLCCFGAILQKLAQSLGPKTHVLVEATATNNSGIIVDGKEEMLIGNVSAVVQVLSKVLGGDTGRNDVLAGLMSTLDPARVVFSCWQGTNEELTPCAESEHVY